MPIKQIEQLEALLPIDDNIIDVEVGEPGAEN
jgi:hypothetical protein